MYSTPTIRELEVGPEGGYYIAKHVQSDGNPGTIESEMVAEYATDDDDEQVWNASVSGDGYSPSTSGLFLDESRLHHVGHIGGGFDGPDGTIEGKGGIDLFFHTVSTDGTVQNATVVGTKHNERAGYAAMNADGQLVVPYDVERAESEESDESGGDSDAGMSGGGDQWSERIRVGTFQPDGTEVSSRTLAEVSSEEAYLDAVATAIGPDGTTYLLAAASGEAFGESLEFRTGVLLRIDD